MQRLICTEGHPCEETDTEGHVMRQTEIKILHLSCKNTKDCSKVPETEKETWNRFSLTALLTPSSPTSTFQNCKIINFCRLSYPVCGTLLWQSYKTNTYVFKECYDKSKLFANEQGNC
jgi:hypothetical protein